ncbi:hypothetical protein BVH01_11400 [Pseudomonas sp. PA1(2017)]|uniref:ATPase, T2SS/T4P/T4SS family n=1 Tax=Pseudomonas sp. PA1(2017) TaxID=1932113 RepID=UPI00096956EB|nr:hypothetical protein [Pseudomonas sp. PA1(2017)]OLU17149.1 hypothetical protein BVH01_11400 [Pseudomonas sp. PA1(2017)]
MQMVEGLGDDMGLASLAERLPETEDLLEQEDDAPIICLIKALLSEAGGKTPRTSMWRLSIKRLVARFCIDGMLREMVQPRCELARLLASWIKVVAKLESAEKRCQAVVTAMWQGLSATSENVSYFKFIRKSRPFLFLLFRVSRDSLPALLLSALPSLMGVRDLYARRMDACVIYHWHWPLASPQ